VELVVRPGEGLFLLGWSGAFWLWSSGFAVVPWYDGSSKGREETGDKELISSFSVVCGWMVALCQSDPVLLGSKWSL
jgi:hypothetical protein